MNDSLVRLTPRELATVLAALRLYQAQPTFPAGLEDPLSNEEVNTLCEQLN